MEDVVTILLLAASAFFVALSIGLLVRYRQISGKISSSTDLGHDLWAALESRLRKQDERVLDVMGKVEVIQSRAFSNQEPQKRSQTPLSASRETERETSVGVITSRRPIDVTSQTPGQGDLTRFLESRLSEQERRLALILNRLDDFQARPARSDPSVILPPPSSSGLQRTSEPRLGKTTELSLLRLLDERSRTSVEVRGHFGVSREHAARLLKDLLDRGLVTRNASQKPFVYELTDGGRRYMTEGSSS